MERGDIWHVSLDPIYGREQAGRRFVLILSRRIFNRLGTSLICPITQGGQFAREKGFAVSLTGLGLRTQGVVLCNQLRVIDLQARQAVFVERVPVQLMDEVLARAQTLLD
jgi:mRNA interferase ChpB